MKYHPFRAIAIIAAVICAFLFGHRCRGQTNQPGTNSPLALQSKHATNAPAVTNAPPPEPPKTPVYVVGEFTVYRTPVGPLLSTDPFHVAALTKLWPSSRVTLIWTPDGPVQFCEPKDDLLPERFRGQKGTNLVFYGHQ